MAMTPRFYSISSLAVELGMDRRTGAGRLRRVRPDGTLPGGHKGWFLATALREMERADSPQEREVPDLIASALEDRLEQPAIIAEREPLVVDLPEAASMLGVEARTVLKWLCGGAPFVKPGNWTNGEGFVVDVSWLLEWATLVAAHLAHIGRDDLHEALQLPG